MRTYRDCLVATAVGLLRPTGVPCERATVSERVGPLDAVVRKVVGVLVLVALALGALLVPTNSLCCSSKGKRCKHHDTRLDMHGTRLKYTIQGWA